MPKSSHQHGYCATTILSGVVKVGSDLERNHTRTLHGKTGPGWAGAIVIAATPVVVWWLVGDLSYRGRVEGELDYLLKMPDIPGWSEAVLGGGALISGAVSALALVAKVRAGRVDSRWLIVVALLALIGALLGFAVRVLTAGVIGANLGPVFLVIFSVLPTLLVMAWAAVLARRIRS